MAIHNTPARFLRRFIDLTLLIAVSLGACSQPADAPHSEARRNLPTPEPAATASPAQQQPAGSGDDAAPAAHVHDAPAAHVHAAPAAGIAGLVNAYNRFGFDLYSRLRQRRGNLFYSPYSIATAFSMTYAGARTSTAAEMARTLNLPAGDVHAQAAALAALLTPAAGAYDLDIANRLWAHNDLAVRDNFRSVTATRYDAEIGLLDFAGATEQARQTINLWVSDKTRGKIPALLAPNAIGPRTRLVLTNAIYFKGNWVARFDPAATGDAPFHGAPAGMAPLMHQQGRFDYAQTDNLQVLRLPYEGGALSMLVLLPAAPGGLDAVEADMSWPLLESIIGKLAPAQVDLWLPRFSSSSQFTLNDTLTGLGMREAFNPSAADFSGIDGSRNLYITRAIHEAFIEINEQGSEAAAATAVVMGREGEPRRIGFRADHPFIYLIMDNRSQTVLFVGRLVSPAA